MIALVEYGIGFCIRLLIFTLCPDRSVYILIKTEKFSFSEMLRSKLYL